MRLGVVGYGTGGQHFHVPFIAAAKGVSLAGVVARAPATVAVLDAARLSATKGRTVQL